MQLPRHAALAVFLACAMTDSAEGQVVQRNAHYWLPASYNHAFYTLHQVAARSFYAAHYAHFGVYEAGMAGGDLEARLAKLEREIRALVVEPPRFEPPIAVVAPNWFKIAYTTGAAMDWTHHLHEQLYDILSDDTVEDKKAAGERAISHYLSNARAAFSTRGYGHAFMLAGGTWAEEFARRYPAINGILWAYHWHHAAIYEALMEQDSVKRREAVDRVLRVFVDSVIPNPPSYMPLTAEVAPRFGEMFPAAAHIFDNLHMMHDVVNDIMVDERIGVRDKGREIERMLQQMLFANQEWVIPPTVSAGAHGNMPMSAMTVPTQLPDGRWLPQGHPRAAMSGAGHTQHEESPARMDGGR